MTYFPLHQHHSDPIRILSPRRIMQELPATPPPEPDPPPEGEGDLRGGARVRADLPDSAYWPNHPGAAPEPQSAGPDTASPAAAEPEAEAEAAPEPPHAERARLVRAWLDEHWDVVEAMARAGEAPQRASFPSPPEPTKPLKLPYVDPADRWNKPKMAQFLRHLAATHSVAAAARAVGMSRQSAYKLRARLKGQPFDIAWEAAFQHGYDNLAHAALDRAINGVEVPHYHDGKLVGTSRKYDERLTVAMLAMRNRQGAPLVMRYGAAAEYMSERWDAMVERVATGSATWADEHAALGRDGLAPLDLPDEQTQTDALICKHAPEERPGKRRPGSG